MSDLSAHARESRESAEEALRERERELRLITNNLPGPVSRVDRNLRYLFVNDQYEQVFGKKRSEVIGHTMPEVIGAELFQYAEPNTRRALAGERVTFESQSETDAGGVMHWLVTLVPDLDPDGKVIGFFVIAFDNTARKGADAERDRLIAELSARNSEMEQFTYTVSHDLKSPLVTITGFLGMLEQDIANGNHAGVKADIARIGSAAQRMLKLLGDLLDLSRAGHVTGEAVGVSLGEVVEEARELLSGDLAQRSIQLVVAPGLPWVKGDRSRLIQVVQNLLENAIKYMGPQRQPMIEIGLRPHATKVVCFVRDNGIGIAPRYLEQIFGLFEKLDPKAPGSGVGLALVRRILESHAGRVWAESDGSTGSTFLFALPGYQKFTRPPG